MRIPLFISANYLTRRRIKKERTICINWLCRKCASQDGLMRTAKWKQKLCHLVIPVINHLAWRMRVYDINAYFPSPWTNHQKHSHTKKKQRHTENKRTNSFNWKKLVFFPIYNWRSLTCATTLKHHFKTRFQSKPTSVFFESRILQTTLKISAAKFTNDENSLFRWVKKKNKKHVGTGHIGHSWQLQKKNGKKLLFGEWVSVTV